ncbi:MAG: dihydropteroate synthase [Eubacteriales bacterium]|nr:dihydropteroate synthase [Eubacteriales bacterium]
MQNINSKLAAFRRGSEPRLSGILNLTPDSFSDGGYFNEVDLAVKQAKEIMSSGGSCLDLGAESTRPGSELISSSEELRRLSPVISELAAYDYPFSVDTYKAETAEYAANHGACLINDISGLLADLEMADVVAAKRIGLVLMFNPTILRPEHPASRNFRQFVTKPVFSRQEIAKITKFSITEQMLFYFEFALRRAKTAGIPEENIWLDPGIGFGLTMGENLQLLKEAPAAIEKLGFARYFGVSRKRFLASTLQAGAVSIPEVKPNEYNKGAMLDPRDAATAAVTSYLAAQGVELLRVHNVAANLPALLVGKALCSGQASTELFGQYR